MIDEAERSFAEALAQQFATRGDEIPNAMGGNTLMAALLLSLVNRSRQQHGDQDDARVRHVAMIVGACPRCLGEDAACIECAGKGKPGHRAPNREALLSWVARPLRRLGLRVEPRRQGMPHNHAGDYSQ